MYSKTVTIFDYYESATTGDTYWYPHVLSGVDLITDKGAILKDRKSTRLNSSHRT